jgi:pilus assembly protein Flp/PilA
MMEASMSRFISRFFKDESGATAIEYGLIAALIAVVIIGSVGMVGENVTGTFETVAGGLAQ